MLCLFTVILVDLIVDAPNLASKILNAQQDAVLQTAIDWNKWALCYRGSDNGFSAATFHNNCNNRRWLAVSVASLISHSLHPEHLSN